MNTRDTRHLTCGKILRGAAGCLLMLLAACGGGSSSPSSSSPTSTAPSGTSTPPSSAAGALAFTSSAQATASVGVAYLYTATASDPRAVPLTFSVTSGPAGATFAPLAGQRSALLSWTPAATDTGSRTFTLTVSDGTGQATQTFTVVVAPAASASGSGSGGTSTLRGTFTRQVTTAAQPGLPPINVSYQVQVPQSYVYDPNHPVPFVISELTPLSLWASIAESDGFICVEQQGYLGNGGFTYDYDPLVLEGILADVKATWNVDTKRIYLTGFSAGAHWSYTIGLANAGSFAALGICSGSLGSAVQEGVWILNSTTQPNVPRKVAVGIRHGTQDTVVPVTEGQLARDQLTAAGFPVNYLEINEGHTVDTPELTGLWAYLTTQSLP